MVWLDFYAVRSTGAYKFTELCLTFFELRLRGIHLLLSMPLLKTQEVVHIQCTTNKILPLVRYSNSFRTHLPLLPYKYALCIHLIHICHESFCIKCFEPDWGMIQSIDESFVECDDVSCTFVCVSWYICVASSFLLVSNMFCPVSRWTSIFLDYFHKKKI